MVDAEKGFTKQDKSIIDDRHGLDDLFLKFDNSSTPKFSGVAISSGAMSKILPFHHFKVFRNVL